MPAWHLNLMAAEPAPTQTQTQQPEQSSPSESRHRCYLCSRTYERHDHLSRHLKSHDNERAYRCTECGKGFNRADLLNRHRAAHSKTSAGDVFRKRTPRACEACIKAKTKCDDDRPCKRCKSRDMTCVDSDARSTSQEHASSTSQPESHSSSISSGGGGGAGGGGGVAQIPTPASMPHALEDNNNSLPSASLVNQFPIGQDVFTDPLGMECYGFPDSSFFESIMMPDMANMAQVQIQMPPDVSDFTQDFDLSGVDFDFGFLKSGLTRPSTPYETADDSSVTTSTDPHGDARLRSEAFKKSPWSWSHWIPERNHGCFTGQEEINVQQDAIETHDQHVSPSVRRSVHCELDHEARDRMIRVVTKVAYSKVSMPSFPSLQLLEDLIDVSLLQDSNAVDAYVHASSFSARHTRTELLMAMVAAGARYVALPPVWKMGLIIQEVVRLAMAEVFEADNSATRDIQSLQTYMLWLDIGIWSGFRRKTEIASSFLQPAATMLTWASAFTRSRYQDIIPYPEDDDEALDQKWRSWIEQEGLKRLVLHTFLHDSQVATTHLKNRLVSPAQMMLPAPMTLDLWLAPNSQAWRNIWIARQPPSQSAMPSMMEIFGNLGQLDALGNVVDKPLCTLAACHALAHEVWQCRQQAVLLASWQAQGRRDRWLAYQHRQRDLLDDLMTVHAFCETQQSVAPEILFTIEFLIMSLHVSLEDILLFSGKSGEEEARKVYPRVRTWTQDSEARIAVWHAGQVLRVARTFEQTRLRDFYAVAVYQATLTLWVYGMVTSNTARKSGEPTPMPGVQPSTDTSHDMLAPVNRVFLDDDNDKAAKSFKLIGQGEAGLRNRHGPQEGASWNEAMNFCSLHNSKGVMFISGDILKNNFPKSRNGLPPLVENLVNLISELGKLSGK